MKALTIHQPWAWAIATNNKAVENRSWNTAYRGPLAIHAGQQVDSAGIPFIRERLALAPDEHVGERHLLARGALVAIADLVGVCSNSAWHSLVVNECGCGPWAQPGQYHWQLANVRALPEPIPCRGAQRLWSTPLTALASLDLAAAHLPAGEQQ